MKYVVIFERADDGSWSAYAPDLPGLGVVGATIEEARQLISEGITFHLEALREAGAQVPEPSTRVEEIEPIVA